ncbi:MAG: translation elongation factor Ts [Firmicutes bacterium]|nr:translation elongation factor Ts [Bacillota bacterium]
MTKVTPSQVRELRDRTGAGMMDCKRALEEAEGQMGRAVDILRERGQAQAAKKAGRTASEGVVASYIHPGGRVGVLVEVNCETDFVSATADFQDLCRNIAMHIAASRPRWVRREDVPPAIVEHERDVLRKEAESAGKPAAVVERMVEGRLRRFFSEQCLLEQPYVRDPDHTVGDVVQELVARLGENIVVRRFQRYERGEELE